MTSKQLYINGKDAWDTWGVSLESGSENALLTPASNKELIENKNPNEDGKRVLIGKRYKEDRDIILYFNINASSEIDFLSKYESFTNELDKGFVDMAVRYVRKTYRLTTTSYQDLGYYEDSGKIAVRFNEPNPKNTGSVFTNRVIATEDNKVLLTEDEKGLEI